MSNLDYSMIKKSLISSGLFDPDWYLKNYPDVASSGMDPLDHFVEFGVLLGRDPGPNFSEIFYKTCLPEGASALKSFLLQMMECGKIDVPRYAVINGAAALARTGRRKDAQILVRKYLGEDAERPLHLFNANEAIISGNEVEWLRLLNLYLHPFGVAKISLGPGHSLISRLNAYDVPMISGGPKVSIIMPAYQAAKTIGPSIKSIANQSWKNIEIIVVDDNSTDGTWDIIRSMSSQDSRIRAMRNGKNYGPYISKNLALLQATGDYVTGHDADDWAHPQRIEKHLYHILNSNGSIAAGTGMMLRVNPNGIFDNAINSSDDHSPDGLIRRAFISCIFERNIMMKEIGFYDCVRFAADGEYLRRSMLILGDRFQDSKTFSMICFDYPSSLTNDPENGLRTTSGISETRKLYNHSWGEWHRNSRKSKLFMDFPQRQRSFYAPDTMMSDYFDAL